MEMVAELQGVADLACFVPLFLQGEAFDVFDELTSAEKKNYGKMKVRLLQTFSINRFEAFSQFKSRALQPGESPDSLLADLKRLLRLTGMKDIPKELIECAFIEALPESARMQLKAIANVEKMSVNQILSKAKMLLDVKPAYPVVMAMVKPPEVEVYSGGNDVPVRKEEGRSGLRGRGARGGSRGPRRTVVVCFRCDQPGHMARECPTLSQSRTPASHQLQPQCVPRHQPPIPHPPAAPQGDQLPSFVPRRDTYSQGNC